MYLAGHNIKMHYITDPATSAKTKEFAVGLTVASISSIRGGVINAEGTSNVNYRPMHILTNADNSRHTYELDEGSYLVIFHQGLKKLPKDAVAYVEGTQACNQVGCIIVPQRYYELRGQGNMSAVLMVPSQCHVTIDQGACIAELSLIYEKFEEV